MLPHSFWARILYFIYSRYLSFTLCHSFQTNSRRSCTTFMVLANVLVVIPPPACERREITWMLLQVTSEFLFPFEMQIQYNNCKFHYTFMSGVIPNNQQSSSQNLPLGQPQKQLPSSSKTSTSSSTTSCTWPANKFCTSTLQEMLCATQMQCLQPCIRFNIASTMRRILSTPLERQLPPPNFIV